MKDFFSRKLLMFVAGVVIVPAIFIFLFFQFKNRQVKNILVLPIIKEVVAIPNILAIQEKPSIGLPINLEIPQIGVNANIEYVGIAPDGTMDIPKNPDNVAWFSLGLRPGENGTAVMAGHYGWKNNIPVVFDNLYKLQKGDKIYVKDEKGKTITFAVRESRKYDPLADASAVFGSNDGKSHLNLITCEGIWNTTQKSYSKRLVVFTDRDLDQ